VGAFLHLPDTSCLMCERLWLQIFWFRHHIIRSVGLSVQWRFSLWVVVWELLQWEACVGSMDEGSSEGRRDSRTSLIEKG